MQIHMRICLHYKINLVEITLPFSLPFPYIMVY